MTIEDGILRRVNPASSNLFARGQPIRKSKNRLPAKRVEAIKQAVCRTSLNGRLQPAEHRQLTAL